VEPQAFGKYMLVERIAQGGMAEVYRAVVQGAAGVEKTVALKRILPVLDAAPEFVTMFIDEARIAASLTHVNVAQVFEFGEVGGSYYLAMELIEGVDLGRLHEAARRRGMPLPRAVAAFVIAEAARGLAYAHDKRGPGGALLGIVHRDVSPQNILVSYAGEVKIADFGIAKAVGKLHKTDSGAVMGKLRYMSPEQVTGEPLDGRSDVFSLGIVLWELLTGKQLFDGDNPGRVADQVKRAEVEPPSARAPDVPPELDRICLKALQRARGGRHERAQDLARELSTFVSERAPGLTREDVGALVAELVPRGDETAGLGDAAATTVEQTLPKDGAAADVADMAVAPTPPAGSPAAATPTNGVHAAATRLARRPDAGATPVTPAPKTRRSMMALVGGAAVIAAVGLVYRAVTHHPNADPPPLVPTAIADAGAATTTTQSPPVHVVDPALAAKLWADLDALPRKESAWRGVPAEDYRVLLSAVESTACAAEVAFPDDVTKRLEELQLRREATALARYWKQTGELPPRVADALRAFLRGGRPSFTAGERGWAAAALAIAVDPNEPRYVVERMRENTALARWRDRALDAPAPTGEAPLCDRAALVASYAARAPGPRAAALTRYLAATPLEAPRDANGLRFVASAPERDEAAGTIALSLHVTNLGAAEATLALDAARLAGLDAAPTVQAAGAPSPAPLAAGGERTVTLRFAGVSDAVAEAAVLVLAPGVELRAYAEAL
jgi:Protein kinase domain